jgi:hypothetical protein
MKVIDETQATRRSTDDGRNMRVWARLILAFAAAVFGGCFVGFLPKTPYMRSRVNPIFSTAQALLNAPRRPLIGWKWFDS